MTAPEFWRHSVETSQEAVRNYFRPMEVLCGKAVDLYRGLVDSLPQSPEPALGTSALQSCSITNPLISLVVLFVFVSTLPLTLPIAMLIGLRALLVWLLGKLK